MIDMALAFVLEHPALTAAIIGPRTMEHLESQLTAAEVQLSADVLDRIDEIVAPGTNVNPADAGWQPPALASPGSAAEACEAPNRPSQAAAGKARLAAVRVLVVTNITPDPVAPSRGVFVRDQVAALRRAGIEVELLSFPGGRWNYPRAVPQIRRL